MSHQHFSLAFHFLFEIYFQDGKEEYVFCMECNKAWKKNDDEQHPHHTAESLQFSGELLP